MLSPSGFLLGTLLVVSGAEAALRRFTLDVTWKSRAPDGYTRPQIVVNGTSPGPALIVDQDDDVEILVQNHLSEKTVVHWHGIEQLHTPWSDGVVGLSQRPIAPGGEFLFKWRATEYGTYWYHSHYKSQIADGFYGPIHIRPRAEEKRPFSSIDSNPDAVAAMTAAEQNPHLVVISDWTHLTSSDISRYSQQTNANLPCTNSILVNGKGSVSCLSEDEQKQAIDPQFTSLFTDPDTGRWLGTPSGCAISSRLIQGNFSVDINGIPKKLTDCQATTGPREAIEVDANARWASINFISALTIHATVLSIDDHPMWIYAVDGRYIEPVQVDGLQIFNGNRYSAMVKLDQEPGQYTLRASNRLANQIITGLATLSYSGASKTMPDNPYYGLGGAPISSSVSILNDSTIQPFDNIPPSRTASQTHILHAARYGAPYIWTLDEIPYPKTPRAYAEDSPLLFFPDSPDANNQSLVIRTQNDTWVDLIFTVTEPAAPHSMHKHSNKAYIIGAGTNWNWTTVEEAAAAQPDSFNFDNPILRDGFTTPGVTDTPTWLAVRYHVVNPGAFLLHCHIDPHLSGGMALALLDGADVFPAIPAEYNLGGNGIGTNSPTATESSESAAAASQSTSANSPDLIQSHDPAANAFRPGSLDPTGWQGEYSTWNHASMSYYAAPTWLPC